jgi:hypothetical protein
MARRGRKKRGSLDDAMRWSLDMGDMEKHRPTSQPPPRRSNPPPRKSKDGEPITLPPDPPRKPDRPEPQPALVDDSAVQITRR